MKIVFDIDDTLWGLNQHIGDDTGVVLSSQLTVYNPLDNKNLTTMQKSYMMTAYKHIETYKNIKWYEGVERINQLYLAGYDIEIKSNCYSEEIAHTKVAQLMQILNLPENAYNMQLITDADIGKKEIGEDVDIFVDDSPYNIATSKAKVNLVLKKPWNTSEWANGIIGDKVVLYFDTFDDIMNYLNTVLVNM